MHADFQKHTGGDFGKGGLGASAGSFDQFPDGLRRVRHNKLGANSVGNACMVNPQFAGGKPTMFICGNDAAAKKVVSGILDQFGWETADMGLSEAARAIEPLCMLWCIPGFLRNDWTHAFKLLTKG